MLIATPRDGNCLWHSISITGNTQQSIILRYATLFTILLLKNNFIELIKIKDYPNKYELVFEKYCKLLYIARIDKKNEKKIIETKNIFTIFAQKLLIIQFAYLLYNNYYSSGTKKDLTAIALIKLSLIELNLLLKRKKLAITNYFESRKN